MRTDLPVGGGESAQSARITELFSDNFRGTTDVFIYAPTDLASDVAGWLNWYADQLRNRGLQVGMSSDFGADDGFVYPSGEMSRDEQKAFSDKIKELTGGQGADVVYDPVGGSYSEPALRATNWEGRFLVVGFASGPIPKIPLNLALLKGCQIVGVFWGAFTAREPERNKDNLNELMTWFRDGKIKPHVSKTYALEDAASALKDMAARKVKGKIVLTTE